jgi:hypothetical protein
MNERIRRPSQYPDPTPFRKNSRLGELEAVVERGLTTFVEVGNALMEIQDA